MLYLYNLLILLSLDYFTTPIEFFYCKIWDEPYPYLGKEITPTDLEAIVEKIKTKYRENGYLTTFAYVPEQELKEGKIEIRVLEGRLGEVKIEGNRWFSSSLLKKYIHARTGDILISKPYRKTFCGLTRTRIWK
jgi:hypothetical protein